MNKHEINECHNFWEADMDADIVHKDITELMENLTSNLLIWYNIHYCTNSKACMPSYNSVWQTACSKMSVLIFVKYLVLR